MARIVTVYERTRKPFVSVDMSFIRWHKISEALSRLGHEVDIAANVPRLRGRLPMRLGPNLRRVPLTRVRWGRYDVVKTLFNLGYETLERHGGSGHDFIIAKLGSVVGDRDMEGVYFYGDERRTLFETQQRIAERARYVTLLTEESRALWRACHGARERELLVPGGVDAILPAPGPSPYPAGEQVCVFAGNIYHPEYQPEAHQHLVTRLNDLGRHLAARGVRLHFLGKGDTSRLDPRFITGHGAVPYDRSWDYLRHARTGVVIALGDEPNQNESSKIYHYLRVGLPTVCEAGFPNQGLVLEAQLGRIARNGDMEGMAAAVVECQERAWDREAAIRLMLERHTWDVRARIYDGVIRAEGAGGSATRRS